jgi:hypothetical protein
VDPDPIPVGSETLSMRNSEKFVRDRAAPDLRRREYKGKSCVKNIRKNSMEDPKQDPDLKTTEK